MSQVANFASVAANSHVGAGSITVNDSAGHIQNGLATLEASLSKINTITLTNASTPTLNISYTNFSTYGKRFGGYFFRL